MQHIGVLCAVLCFLIWGFFPVYWKQLAAIPAVQLALHRIVWSFLMLLLYILGTRQWSAFKAAISSWKVLGIYAASSIFILTNWLLFVWAINAGYIVEGSLGYFINPIINVIFGVVLLKERLRRWQWVAIAIAFVGVLVVAIAYAKFPWIAITLALTFAIYGYIKKLAPLSALHGLTLECMLLFAPSVVYLIVVECNGSGAFGHVDTASTLLLVGGGLVTIAPLLLFATAAPRISLSLLGITQYIAPSVQFILGVFLYHEDFSLFKLIGFVLVWLALVIYSTEGIIVHQKEKAKDDVVVTPVDRQLDDISALQLAMHRIVWSFFVLVLVLLCTRQWSSFTSAALTRYNVVIYTISAAMIFTNWLLFVWAVNAGHVVETSLGYFINPLVNVLLGVAFLHERLRVGQWVSLAVAAAGVLVVALAYGKFPWIAVSLAASFGLYGLVKKKAPLNALYGLTLETGVLVLPSLAYLVVVQANGSAAFLHVDAVKTVLMLLAGIVTIIPLLLFSSAAQRIPLSLLGILQYVCPSLQFLVGVLVYHEPFSTHKLIGFVLVWLALVIFTAEGFWWHRRVRSDETSTPSPLTETNYIEISKSSDEKQGIICALGAFTMWGFFPIYWKQLPDVPDIQVAVHRVFWSGLILIAMIFGTCQWRAFRAAAFTRRNFMIYGIAIVLLTGNFFIYVFATKSNRIIELSLGYFINPMVNAALGRVFLKEHLTKWQWVALGIALVGVLIPTIAYGKFPYLAITLAVTSGLYNLAKKMAPLDSFHGLTLETSLMLVPAAIFLLVVNGSGTGAFGHSDTKTDLLLVGTGVITILPLLLFAKAAPVIPMALMGILQYICPTITFLIGLFIYHEPFTTTKLIGFIVIWIALIVFTSDSIRTYRQPPKPSMEADVVTSPSFGYKRQDEQNV
ncbi:hypothetical protein ACHHYP_09748 [Achlya hypogyna]|uniref:EamA domain-containing protein n=1 Tax=Achlya hypogyna TaxID=1202772 RepID=A0A1V9YMN3_ACHHY|nr:hypothetical protein ACHHYP_09748 [Achlya hypogyna]